MGSLRKTIGASRPLTLCRFISLTTGAPWGRTEIASCFWSDADKAFEVFDDAHERELLRCGGPDQFDDLRQASRLDVATGRGDRASEEPEMIGDLLDARRRRHEVQPAVIKT